MRFPNRKIVEQMRKNYPVGARVKLRKMDDCNAPSVGTKGTVRGVDDIASLLVDWDNGAKLNAAYGDHLYQADNRRKSLLRCGGLKSS